MTDRPETDGYAKDPTGKWHAAFQRGTKPRFQTACGMVLEPEQGEYREDHPDELTGKNICYECAGARL